MSSIIPLVSDHLDYKIHHIGIHFNFANLALKIKYLHQIGKDLAGYGYWSGVE
jgi:hypothetical protein